MMSDLERFINYNNQGEKRAYKPTRKQIKKFEDNNSWVETNGVLWTYKDYKTCYMVIRKDKDSYIPMVGGSKLSEYPDIIKLADIYKDLDEAKISCIRFVDSIQYADSRKSSEDCNKKRRRLRTLGH
jgi:hypothetical protein